MRAVRIGITVAFFHPNPDRRIYRGKRLQYAEERMAHAVARTGAIPLWLPAVPTPPTAMLDAIDGLVLSGGDDVAPEHYGETPQDPRWAGDAARDRYEIALVEAALHRKIPILGICRGIQLLNVALGGDLFQDLPSQYSAHVTHRDAEAYDALGHRVAIRDEETFVAKCYGGATELLVNSVHHQGIRRLATDLDATGHAPDGLVEAVQLRDPSRFAAGVQWHPEWLEPEPIPPATAGRADGDRLFAGFTAICDRWR